MRSISLVALVSALLASAPIASCIPPSLPPLAPVADGQIGFNLYNNTCGDGSYIGCFSLDAGECCSLPRNTVALAAMVSVYDPEPPLSIKVTGFSGTECVEGEQVFEQTNSADGESYFCAVKPDGVTLASAHYELGSGQGGLPRKDKRDGGARAKQCRTVDHVVFPGGARANIEGLEARQLDEMVSFSPCSRAIMYLLTFLCSLVCVSLYD